MCLCKKIKDFFTEADVLLNNIPSLFVSLFFLSVVGMNLLANKSINFGVDWLALDTAFLTSWLSFLTMDVITKRFGPRASIIVSLVGLLVNLLFAFIFFLVSVIPGTWSTSNENKVINTAFDESFGGSWFIIVGSATAYISSAVINNLLNWFVGKCLKGDPNGFCAFALRSYLSTAIAQFVDNLVFSSIVSLSFFGWSFLQCLTASFTKMIFELIFEVVFSPVGYMFLKRMEKQNIGQQYIEMYQIELKDLPKTEEEKDENNDGEKDERLF